MNVRPLRTLGATLAAVAALVVSLFAGQDLWHYWQAISAGFSEWATSGQGLWMLACGVGELFATIVLVAAAVRLLGARPIRPIRPMHPQVAPA
jgi:multisubunit Na+/H+ antiporter MnhB subunit